MDPVARTAFYCCGVRMLDAQSPRPVCDDRLAERFMDAEARAVFAPFEKLRGPNLANAARHRLIDDILRERLAADPGLQIILLGAGLDTRAFRLAGGNWLELDAPTLIAHKERILPAADAPNPLHRVGVDFARERLADVLAAHAAPRWTVIVLEGVSMYLTPTDLAATAAALHGRFPAHMLVCDLFNRRFLRRFGGPIRRRIRALGGDLVDQPDDPAGAIAALGYRLIARRSIAGAMVDFGSAPFPRWALNTLLRTLRDGYTVCTFATEE